MAAPWKDSSGFRALLIVLAISAAYAPALAAGFVFDDRPFVIESALVRGPLWRIWFTTDAPDWWPLTWTAFWLEWRAFGDHALGYHLVNLALHAAASVLLWRILRALAAPGAWLAGLLFAVHPVGVESAAWIAELKNTLSAVLLLGCALAWIRFDGSGRRRDAGLATVLFALALLAKTSIVLAPLVLASITLKRHGRIGRAGAVALGAMAAAAVAAAITTIWFQRMHPLAMWALPERGLLERAGDAAWALATYLRHAFLPVGLGFVYPDWPVAYRSPLFLAPLLALAAVAAVLWRTRRGLGGPVLLALGVHLALIAPALGLIDMAYLKIGPVSNHLQYAALVGPVALVAAAVAWLYDRWPRPVALVSSVAVAALAASTFDRSGSFSDDLTLWRRAVRDAPESAVARLELAGLLLQAGARDEALQQFGVAAEVARAPAQRHRALSFQALYSGRMEEAVAEARAAAGDGRDPLLQRDLGVVLVLSGRGTEAVGVLRPLVTASPDDLDFVWWLASALEAGGRLPEVAEVLAEASRRRPGVTQLEERLAVMLVRLGYADEARRHVAAALGFTPNDPRVESRLRELLASANARP